MTNFNPSEWILVGDTNICPHTKEQVKVCQNMDIRIKGAILCNEKENENNPACLHIPAFPSFCHVDKNMCVSGLRETKESFDELQKIAIDAPQQTQP